MGGLAVMFPDSPRMLPPLEASSNGVPTAAELSTSRRVNIFPTPPEVSRTNPDAASP